MLAGIGSSPRFPTSTQRVPRSKVAEHGWGVVLSRLVVDRDPLRLPHYLCQVLLLGPRWADGERRFRKWSGGREIGGRIRFRQRRSARRGRYRTQGVSRTAYTGGIEGVCS